MRPTSVSKECTTFITKTLKSHKAVKGGQHKGKSVRVSYTLPITITDADKKSDVGSSKIYTSKKGKRVQLMEITKNGFIHLLLLDPVTRNDYLEIEEVVLAIRKDNKLYKGFGSKGAIDFKFYKDKSDYSKKSLPSIWSTYYNNMSGKKGMDIIWGLSKSKTIILYTPTRKVVKI
jgi:hypothetical protein